MGWPHFKSVFINKWIKTSITTIQCEVSKNLILGKKIFGLELVYFQLFHVKEDKVQWLSLDCILTNPSLMEEHSQFWRLQIQDQSLGTFLLEWVPLLVCRTLPSHCCFTQQRPRCLKRLPIPSWGPHTLSPSIQSYLYILFHRNLVGNTKIYWEKIDITL